VYLSAENSTHTVKFTLSVDISKMKVTVTIIIQYGIHIVFLGWGGKCGLNEVTCDLPGFGAEGKITYDW
jgi:hypothetical protein